MTSDIRSWVIGVVVFGLGMIPLGFIIAFLKGDAHYTSVTGNVLLLASFAGHVTAAGRRVKTQSRFLTQSTARLWVLSLLWSSVLLFLALGARPHVALSLESRLGAALVGALVSSIICLLPDCRPRSENAP